jgi:hypothetical protein
MKNAAILVFPTKLNDSSRYCVLKREILPGIEYDKCTELLTWESLLWKSYWLLNAGGLYLVSVLAALGLFLAYRRPQTFCARDVNNLLLAPM